MASFLRGENECSQPGIRCHDVLTFVNVFVSQTACTAQPHCSKETIWIQALRRQPLVGFCLLQHGMLRQHTF